MSLRCPKKEDEEVNAYVSKMSNNKDAPRKYSLINHICSGPGWYLDKYDLGLEGCLQEVMQDPQCKKDIFLYGADSNCGCFKVPCSPVTGCQVTSVYEISSKNDVKSTYASYMPGVCCVSDCLTIQAIAYRQDQI